jgi:UDP-glucose 6-dehydrogenase
LHEPGLSELLAETIDAGRLRFCADKGQAVRHGEVILICVGTPSRADGSPNLQFLEAGAGCGGSCFPKDVAAFAHRSAELGVDLGILPVVARERMAYPILVDARNALTPAWR